MNRRCTLLFTVVVFFSVIIQTTILPFHIVTAFKPDLLLVVMVYLALRSSFQIGTPLAWLLGLLKDVFSGLCLGLNAFTFLIIFLFIKSIADRLYAESGFLFMVTVCLASLACVTIDFLLLIMFTNTSGILYSMVAGLIPHLLVNSFAASLVVLLPGFSRDQEIA